jgi:Transposase DDE domain
MTWETKLISTYYLICDYKDLISPLYERYSNNNHPEFTDEEVMCIYLFCTTDEFRLHEKKEIYAYADRHLRSWFPKLPKYPAFSLRVNRLSNCFLALGIALSERANEEKAEFYAPIREFLMDSLPIMLAKGKRCKSAKVAPDIAQVGYCATKNMAYYGCKLHVAALMAALAELPTLFCATLTGAAPHDNMVFKNEIAPHCIHAKVYADSAYLDKSAATYFLDNFNLKVVAIQKRAIGQKELFYEQKLNNTAISRVRQPIEGFFNHLIELTGIQDASKCRSSKGLLTHVFGKIAAFLTACFI